jgi:hypothetical protein
MATKRKKKKPPGGMSGAPPRSEPRIQLFTKFAGCNFQLATRDFDNIFDEGQDAQTDLMPMLMAIQNNAGIAPFGGIETRQDLVRLFEPPTGKLLTGVATLIGDELYAACEDSTVHYGTLAAGTLESEVALTDNNDTYFVTNMRTVSGTATGSPLPKTFTATYQVVGGGVGTTTHLTGVTFIAEFEDPHNIHARCDVHIHHESEALSEGLYHARSYERLNLSHAVTAGDHIIVVVTSAENLHVANWTVRFYESIEDNTWTCLGYADDQLIGMTANKQIWNGTLGNYTLENGLAVTDPASGLTIGSLTVVEVTAGSLLIDDAWAEATPFRMTISYTMLNRFGPTKPSPTFTFYASKPTTEWSTASFVQVSGTAPNITTGVSAGITAIELYYTEGEYQEPAFLGRVNLPDITTGSPPPTTKPWSFNWTGYMTDTSMWTVANLTPPTQNYTTGVPASKMAVLDGQLYFWGGDPEYRIWIGGAPGNRLSISPGTGGGFVDVDPGVGTIVKNVLKFKTQQGAAIVTSLCDNANSQKENRYNLVETSISISQEQSIKGWMAEKIAGAVGCKSSRGAVAAADGLYAISRYGLAITTLTMEYNSQLQVMYISDPIAPVFLKQYGNQLAGSVLLEADGILYMTFGALDATLENVLFCYDIMLKAWWTYTLDLATPILNMIHIDSENAREGIGIITADAVFLLPTTMDEAIVDAPDCSVLIESGELTTMQPLQNMHHLSQLEFRFDYFVGDLAIVVTMIDQFGRTITANKIISYTTVQHQLSEYIRIDQVVESYKISMTGQARMRMTHFMSKSYPKSNRIGMVWGFDSQQSHTTAGSIHRTFSSYNDLKEAIIP